MLGNDVVDLTVDKDKHLNQRFINRVLTGNERTMLAQSPDKNLFLWSLWATKEACYKACQKTDNQLLFSPSNFAFDDQSLNKLLKHDRNQDFYGTLKHQHNVLQLKLCWKNKGSDDGPEHFNPDPQPTAVHATAVLCATTKPLNQVQVYIARMTQATTHKNQSTEVRKLAKKLLQSNDIKANIHRPPLQIKDYTKPGPPMLLTNDDCELPHEISLSHDNEWLAVALLI